MKSFSPAGMAVKGLFGGPGWPFGGAPAGREGQSGAQTFGNPNGALSGGGAAPSGGDNANGPNQGGFVPGGGGGGPFSGQFVVHAVGVAGFTVGYADGMFASDPFHNGGSVIPVALNGNRIGAFWNQYNANQLYFGMYGSHVQSDFTWLSFIDRNGRQQYLLSAAVNDYQDVTQADPPAPSGVGASWRWTVPGGQLFNFNSDNTIDIDQFTAVPFSFQIGINSTGPLQGAGYNGDGTGYYQGTLNGGFGSGTITPDPVNVNANELIVCGWGSSAPFAGGYFGVVIQGSHPQDFFAEITLGAPVSLAFATAGATHYSTTDFPGFTIWTWSDSHEFDHIGANVSALIS